MLWSARAVALLQPNADGTSKTPDPGRKGTLSDLVEIMGPPRRVTKPSPGASTSPP